MKKSKGDSKKGAAMKRMRILYKGRVQGVGFRYTAERVALDAGVTGWVRNLPDGDVELLAEGDEGALRRTAEGITQSEVGRHIRKSDVTWEEFRGEFTEFRIEFCY